MNKDSIRLDKYLADMNIGTRSEVKSYIKKGLITVNQIPTRDPGMKIHTEQDVVCYNHENIKYTAYEYFMLYKPSNVLSATQDRKQPTVIDLITDSHVKNLFPVGRLDKDTEGLLLITNDGELAHHLLSPNHHVAKTYYARIQGLVTDEDIKVFQNGIDLEDDFRTMPADLRILHIDSVEQTSEIEITIYEGKFHQIKRMFEAVDKKVLYLKRLSMGSLQLDPSLKAGDYRPLTETERIGLLQN